MRIFRWATVNFTLLALFVLGNLYTIEWMLILSIGLFWVTSILGILILIVLACNRHKFIAAINRSKSPSVPYIVDISYDAVCLFAILYFGYMWLAYAYMFQMLTLAVIAHYRN